MNHRELIDFPRLLDTIANFLNNAKVPPDQQDALMAAREAFSTIIETLYYGVEKIYPCGRPSRIAVMPLSRK